MQRVLTILVSLGIFSLLSSPAFSLPPFGAVRAFPRTCFGIAAKFANTISSLAPTSLKISEPVRLPEIQIPKKAQPLFDKLNVHIVRHEDATGVPFLENQPGVHLLGSIFLAIEDNIEVDGISVGYVNFKALGAANNNNRSGAVIFAKDSNDKIIFVGLPLGTEEKFPEIAEFARSLLGKKAPQSDTYFEEVDLSYSPLVRYPASAKYRVVH